MHLTTEINASAEDRAQAVESSSIAGLVGPDHPRRKLVEEFIARRFRATHGARVSAFMPQFLALFDDCGAVLAAVGMRDAGDERLFLEYYLDIPVEQAIRVGAALGELAVTRERIVEIGNLASLDRRVSRRLFNILARHLHRRHFDWAVFTGCSSLHRMVAALGIETICLGSALQSRLPLDQQTWGGYYEDNPRVAAGRVGLGRRVLDRLSIAA